MKKQKGRGNKSEQKSSRETKQKSSRSRQHRACKAPVVKADDREAKRAKTTHATTIIDDAVKPPAKTHATTIIDDAVKSPAKTHATTIIDDALAISDIVDCIKPYLSTTRELYHLGLCSRSLLSNITYEDVVSFAVREGGKPQKVMKDTVSLIEEEKIYVPSVLRLLRLCIATRCEAPGCRRHAWSYPYHDGGRYGIHLCRSCLASHKTRVYMNKKVTPLLKHPRMCGIIWSRLAFIYDEAYTDRSGDPAGPILTDDDRGETNLEEILAERDVHNNPHKQHTAAIVATYQAAIHKKGQEYDSEEEV